MSTLYLYDRDGNSETVFEPEFDGSAEPAVVAVWCNSHPIVGRSACIAAVGEAQVLAWKAEEAEVDGSYEAACRLADERHHEVRAA
jgi:hypothetical protein